MRCTCRDDDASCRIDGRDGGVDDPDVRVQVGEERQRPARRVSAAARQSSSHALLFDRKMLEMVRDSHEIRDLGEESRE